MLPPEKYGLTFGNETDIPVDVDIYWNQEDACGTNRVTLAPYAEFVPKSGDCEVREMWVLPNDTSLLETVGYDKSTKRLNPLSVKARKTIFHPETKGVWVVTVVKVDGKLKFKIQSYW
jgi:hypothetical protein